MGPWLSLLGPEALKPEECEDPSTNMRLKVSHEAEGRPDPGQDPAPDPCQVPGRDPVWVRPNIGPYRLNVLEA